MSESIPSQNDVRQRQEWMVVFAKASADSLEPLWENLDDKPGWTCIRPPESGMVMARARAAPAGVSTWAR